MKLVQRDVPKVRRHEMKNMRWKCKQKKEKSLELVNLKEEMVFISLSNAREKDSEREANRDRESISMTA